MNAQIITHFHDNNKIMDKKCSASLFSVEIYENMTKVVIELIPKKDYPNLSFHTSPNTFIIMENGQKFPILGFERANNGITSIDREPFYSKHGWKDVKKDSTYHYTLVFKGRIPPGLTKFSLIDYGSDDYPPKRGYSFHNYILDNPNTGNNTKANTSWVESDIMQYADEHNDGICGIYEGIDYPSYKLGVIKLDNTYRIIFLNSKEYMEEWVAGDIKAVLRPSATKGLFKGDWIMANKRINSDCYFIFDGISMKKLMNKEEYIYIKMYPTSSYNEEEEQNPKEWLGTGFALNNGYIATNYHVVDKAKTITIQGIKGDFETKYYASTISYDKDYDIAILKMNDIRFTGFGTIPYQIKTKTAEVGEEVFVLGYPLTSTMGDEIKLSTGIISSRTGFQGDASLYQISAPIQPGNSGGPLFDMDGNLIGIVNAKHRGAENVGYAIKTSYLTHLIDKALPTSAFPTGTNNSSSSLISKVKVLKNFVFLITCSDSYSTLSSLYEDSGETSKKGIEEDNTLPKERTKKRF